MSLDDELAVPYDSFLPPDHRAQIKNNEGTSILLNKSTCLRPLGRALLVGRQAAVADVRIQHGSISRKHALIYFQNDNLVLRDLGSKYGTHVNQQRVQGTVLLQNGDEILFGKQHMFCLEWKPLQETASVNIVSDRAQREAEIQAAMQSLDETPVYTQFESKEQPKLDEGIHKNAKKYKVPISESLDIPYSSERKSAAGALAIEPSGARFVVGGMDGTLRFYDFSGMDRVRQEPFKTVVPDEGHWIVDAAYSNSGDRLLVASGGAQPVLLDRDGHELLRFVRGDMYVSDQSKTTGHTAAVSSVDWHPLEREIVLTGSADGTARLWNLKGKRHFEMLICDKVFLAKNENGQRTPVTCVAFHPAGREFALGTVCGSVQIFNPSRASGRPERTIFDAHGESSPIDNIIYSTDGKKLASRSSKAGTCICWDPRKLSPSSTPIAVCEGLPNTHEGAGLAFNRDASVLCAGSLEMNKDKKEVGTLKFFPLTKAEPDNSLKANLEVPIKSNVGLIALCWHSNLNQIFVTCSDGSVIVFYDPEDSEKGAVSVMGKAGKATNVLGDLLRKKASTSIEVSGEIITPFATVRKRARDQDEADYVPERPATSKHKADSQPGGVATFQQYIAKQNLKKNQIAGVDPREALLKYGNIGDKNRILADTTAEQEQEDHLRGVTNSKLD